MPRDAVSRTANVERIGRHKWVNPNQIRILITILVWSNKIQKRFLCVYIQGNQFLDIAKLNQIFYCKYTSPIDFVSKMNSDWAKKIKYKKCDDNRNLVKLNKIQNRFLRVYVKRW